MRKMIDVDEGLYEKLKGLAAADQRPLKTYVGRVLEGHVQGVVTGAVASAVSTGLGKPGERCRCGHLRGVHRGSEKAGACEFGGCGCRAFQEARS